MSKAFEKVKLGRVAAHRNTFDMSAPTLTTTNFNQMNCMYSLPILPGDDLKIKPSYFCRMAPLAVPTFGRAKWCTATIFVPYHSIAMDYNDWVNGFSISRGKNTCGRWFYAKTLNYLFASQSVLSRLVTGSSIPEDSYDFTYDNGHYKLSNLGRFYYRILKQLGYDLVGGLPSMAINPKFNALPLIAFVKGHYDYLSRSATYNTSPIGKLLYAIRTLDTSVTSGDSSVTYITEDGELSLRAILDLLQGLYTCYPSDYFTSAWRHPNSVLSSTRNGLDDVTSYKFVGEDGSSVTKFNRSDVNDVKLTNNAMALGQRSLDYLERMARWLSRNNYVGTKSADRILARFGIKPTTEGQDLSELVSTSESPMMVGDIMSTADTSSSDGGMLLGSYSGKGIVKDDVKEIHFKSRDYGMLFVYGYMSVEPIWQEGVDRYILHSNPLDEYTAELDTLTANPISNLEITTNRKRLDLGEVVKSNETFGFTELYNEYRFKRGVVSGDFNTDANMSAWYFKRHIPQSIQEYGDSTFKAQDSAVTTNEANLRSEQGDEYNNIFAITDSSVDHLYFTAYFDVKAIRNIANSSQAIGLPQGDLEFNRSGAFVQ